GSFIPLPGLPAELTADLGGIPLVSSRSLGLFSLTLIPYLTAAALWLLLSALSPSLQRKRDGTHEERAAFDRGILWLALPIASILAFAQAVRLEAMSDWAPTPPALVLMLGTSVAGMSLLLALAFTITRIGIGNGIAWIALAASYLAALPVDIPAELRRLSVSNSGYFRLPMAAAVLLGLVALCRFYLERSHEVPLVRIDGDAAF